MIRSVNSVVFSEWLDSKMKTAILLVIIVNGYHAMTVHNSIHIYAYCIQIFVIIMNLE